MLFLLQKVLFNTGCNEVEIFLWSWAWHWSGHSFSIPFETQKPPLNQHKTCHMSYNNKKTSQGRFELSNGWREFSYMTIAWNYMRSSCSLSYLHRILLWNLQLVWCLQQEMGRIILGQEDVIECLSWIKFWNQLQGTVAMATSILLIQRKRTDTEAKFKDISRSLGERFVPMKVSNVLEVASASRGSSTDMSYPPRFTTVLKSTRVLLCACW